jgi:hypothetical protein
MNGLEHRVTEGRMESWERSVHISHMVVHAQDDE